MNKRDYFLAAFLLFNPMTIISMEFGAFIFEDDSSPTYTDSSELLSWNSFDSHDPEPAEQNEDSESLLPFINTYESPEQFAAEYFNHVPKDEYYSLLTVLMKPSPSNINITISHELLIKKIGSPSNTFICMPIKDASRILRFLGVLYTSPNAYTYDQLTLQFREFLLNKESFTPYKETLIRNLSALPRNKQLNTELVQLLQNRNQSI